MTARRPLLLPLVPIYRVGLWFHARRRSRHPAALTCPTLSVGSISAGGAGKTPFVIALAQILQTMGYTADILSRGYGRNSTATLRVDPAGTSATFGDEPLLLARTLGVPVYVGRSRHAAGLLAERELPPQPNHIHLLDDAFSHRALARTADLVLVTAQDLDDTLLPAGNLREPRSALARAHILVARTAEEDQIVRYIAAVPALAGKPLWFIDRQTTLPATTPGSPFLFSAIARPTDLERAVRAQGTTPAAVRAFPDHHRYTHRDITALCALAAKTHADGFLMTAKDHVKLTSGMLRQLTAIGPVAVANLAVSFAQPRRVTAELSALLQTAEPSANA